MTDAIKGKTDAIRYHSKVESKKMIQTNLYTKQKLVHRHRRQTYGYQKGKEGGKNEESGINICTLLYIGASLVAQRL